MSLSMFHPACRALPLAALLLLGGCSLFRGSNPVTAEDQETPEQRACRAEAERSPQVLALYRERFPDNTWNTQRVDREQRVAFNRAYRDCLRARGLAMPGGVEPVVPR